MPRRLLVLPLFFLAVALAAPSAGQPPAGKDKAAPKAAGPQVEEKYARHPDTVERPDVPHGTLTKHSWNESKTFPNTERDYWVYVPAQYKADGPPACVMVFQDGSGYITGTPPNVPVVFDNLIHNGYMPVTVGVFINPGHNPSRGGRTNNRSFEYDTLSPDYANFLLTEILPEVEKTVKLRHDAAGRGIGGRSSGGICAFTVAWEKPEEFHKVWSAIGSYTNIRHGDQYPGMIRKTPKKPIRIFQQDGSNDLNNEHGNWFLANLQMASSLQKMDYDCTHVWGEGGHSGRHEAAILPDALRWLWRDWRETK
jgi:enterochelin esterase-like enzyme